MRKTKSFFRNEKSYWTIRLLRAFSRFTTPNKRRVQFTQQSSSKVNLHCHYLSPKHPNVYMMNNSYLLFTFQKEPIAVQIKLQLHSQGGKKCKMVGSLREAFNIYPPCPTPPTTHQKTQLEDKGCQQHASHNEMLPHDPEAMFVFKKAQTSRVIVVNRAIPS